MHLSFDQLPTQTLSVRRIMSYGQCIVIFNPKFLESDGIFCLVPLLVQQKKKDEKYRENDLGDFQRFA